MKLELHATPLSHFARKIRILLDEFKLDYELVFVDDLLSSDPEDFGGNPILRIPTLVDPTRDGGVWLVESDQIARYLVENYDPQDRFAFCSMNVEQRNALSMINAVMGAEVELLLSGRSGIENVEGLDYFRRYRVVLERCLAWIEAQGPSIWPELEPSYLDIALACMWDHLEFYSTVDAGGFDWIRARVQRFCERESFARSAPGAQGLPRPGADGAVDAVDEDFGGESMSKLEIWTDGACRGNPGPGGWGAYLVFGEHQKELWGGERDTTNNRMELLAAIRALEALTRQSQVVLHTDSTYVRNGITSWMKSWKKNGWKTSSKKPVKNRDLWQRLDELAQKHEIDWRWVKGHAGDPGNERADMLANRGCDELS